MAFEKWRMTRTEVNDLLKRYEKAVQDDAGALLHPTDKDTEFLGKDFVQKRLDLYKEALRANQEFTKTMIEDLPDLCAGPASLELPARPVVEFLPMPEGVPTLPSNSYGSMASVYLHLLRDWSGHCEHVYTSTYAPAIAELKALLPQGTEVLVPGAGLARLALALAQEGYKVEANEGSRLFLTVADYVLNRAPQGGKLFPMAHVFSENFGLAQQYMEIEVPVPFPGSMESPGFGNAKITMMPGDFIKTYQRGGPGHRKFRGIVTCFFLDTVVDFIELFEVLDDLLEEGGVWVNVGPLNWRKEARLKLTWEEIITIYKGRGYQFATETSMDTDYHLQRGLKMYTESYKCALVAAVKGPLPSKV